MSFSVPPTLEQVAELQAQLLEALNGGAAHLKTVLPSDVLVSLLRATEAILKTEPSLVELSVDDPQAEVLVFGDTHGHFPDVAYMLNQLGYPSASRIYVFNGDYVDRGSWGVELLAVLCALKCAAPRSVYLLRGNHESSTCTKYYGYGQEVRAKYEKQSKDVYAASKKMFTALPLAACIQGNTLVMHGGLFRRPPDSKRGAKRRKPNNPSRAGAASVSGLVPGSLDDLRRATKGGIDPDGTGASLLATDVLWSDPVAAPGFRENDARGVGLTFGPDVTEAFLTANGLRLIIRSHEGPDARDKRSDLPQVLQGYSVDHDTPAGQLVTVFSAPDYPQFQAPEPDDEESFHRYENLAAVAVLKAPDYATPTMRTFEAVKPRPKADAYYDYATSYDSDTEAPAGTETTGAGGSELSTGDLDCDEVQGPPAMQPEGSDTAGYLPAAEPKPEAAAEVPLEPPQAEQVPPEGQEATAREEPAQEAIDVEQQVAVAATAVDGPAQEVLLAPPQPLQPQLAESQPTEPQQDGGGVVAAAVAGLPDLVCSSEPEASPVQCGVKECGGGEPASGGEVPVHGGGAGLACGPGGVAPSQGTAMEVEVAQEGT